MIQTVGKWSLALLCAAAVSACSSLGVKPWERDLHARADMQGSALDTAIDEHIYFSKEATSGGRGFAGGGCGCN
ncbi:MAG: DUF4266 domain-containing protein [Steroidobacteraceae bacterium]